MNSTVENLEPTKAKVTVEVSYEELEPEMAKAYKEIAKQVNIPGFRKGHIPARVIDQRFGRGAVIEQVINQVLPDYLSQAIVENDLRPLTQPEIEVEEVPAAEGEPGGKLVFTATVGIVPNFDLPDLDNRAVEVEAIEVSDEDIAVELDELRSRFATLKNLDRPAENGDFLTLDITAKVDGEEIDSLADVSYELGSGSMLDGQDEALQGVVAGDERQFHSVVRGGEHAGADSVIDVKVSAVKERELPEVDDDFAQMVSEFDTADELREDSAKQVREAKKGQQAVVARNLLLSQILDETEILLPEEVIEAETARRIEEGADEEQRAEVRERVTTDIRRQILLDTLAEERAVQVDQQELIDFMMHTAQTFGMDLNQMFQDQEQVQNMYGELARTKAIVSVLATATVKDTEGNEVDLSEFTKDRAQAAAEAAAKAAAEEALAASGGGDGEEIFSINVDDLED